MAKMAKFPPSRGFTRLHFTLYDPNLAQIQAEIAQNRPKITKIWPKMGKFLPSRGFILPYMTQI